MSAAASSWRGLSDEARLETYRSTLRMIVDHPWFGTGLGDFCVELPRLSQRPYVDVGGLG